MAVAVLGPVERSPRPYKASMSVSTTNYIVLAATISVALVLFLGLFNMMRGGSANVSQMLMRWRVGLQFVAIVIIMGVLWLRS
jgi:hypothetical protein